MIKQRQRELYRDRRRKVNKREHKSEQNRHRLHRWTTKRCLKQNNS
jgi:hypothetical protein